jgi:hypothetical protein
MESGTDPSGGMHMSWQKAVTVALVAVAVGVLVSYLAQRPTGIALLRGNTTAVPQVTTPINETMPAAAVTFEWKGPTDLARLVVVDVAQPQKPIIDREVAGERYEPTPEERKLLVSGHSYHWYVEAKGPQGRGRSSAAAQFEVR